MLLQNNENMHELHTVGVTVETWFKVIGVGLGDSDIITITIVKGKYLQ